MRACTLPLPPNCKSRILILAMHFQIISKSPQKSTILAPLDKFHGNPPKSPKKSPFSPFYGVTVPNCVLLPPGNPGKNHKYPPEKRLTTTLFLWYAIRVACTYRQTQIKHRRQPPNGARDNKRFRVQGGAVFLISIAPLRGSRETPPFKSRKIKGQVFPMQPTYKVNR